MKKEIKSKTSILNSIVQDNIITITMYLHPIIYSDSEIVEEVIEGTIYTDRKGKYHTDVNPYREINGPLSEYGEELEPPISDEYNSFVSDCRQLVEAYGFTVIKQYRSEDSKKSEYIIVFGVDNTPYGAVVYDLRISAHPFDATFPEELKDYVLNYLQMNKILDESATKAGINFSIEKVTVGSVKHDTWDRAFNRLDRKLRNMRNSIKKQLNAIDRRNF